MIRTAIEKNIHIQLLDELKSFVNECDESLQKMCSTHYSSVLDSLNQLVVLRHDLDSFKVANEILKVYIE